MNTIIRAAKAQENGPDSPRTVGADHRRDMLDGMKKKLGDFCHLPQYGIDPFKVINEQSVVDAKYLALGAVLATISPLLYERDFLTERELIVSCMINGAQANLHFIKKSNKAIEISDGWETEQVTISMGQLQNKFARYRPCQLVVNEAKFGADDHAESDNVDKFLAGGEKLT